MFDGLPNKETIKLRIKAIPVSVGSAERRIKEMAENVRAQLTAGLKEATVVSIELDESVDVNDSPSLAAMARNYDLTEREELKMRTYPKFLQNSCFGQHMGGFCRKAGNSVQFW